MKTSHLSMNASYKQFKYLNEVNFKYLCDGLTISPKDLECLEGALAGLDKVNNLPSNIVAHNVQYGSLSDLPESGSQIIVSLDILLIAGRSLTTATIWTLPNSQLPPTLHIQLQSPSLDIPQRVEIPLRYLLNGLSNLSGTYMVYLHALQINEAETFVYYGVTKRGWMKRFSEHMKAAVQGKSKRAFPKLLGEGIQQRFDELINKLTETNPFKKVLTGTYHVVCAAGRSKQNAFDIETYLINKRSISLPVGLNMVQGRRTKSLT